MHTYKKIKKISLELFWKRFRSQSDFQSRRDERKSFYAHELDALRLKNGRKYLKEAMLDADIRAEIIKP